MLFFHNIASWCVPNRRVGSIADSRRRHSLSGAGVPVVNLIRLAIGGESDDPPLDVGSVQADLRVDH
jgi:hypothetical protein